MMTTNEEVLVCVRGSVGILTLNRPTRLNAWTGPMATALYDGMKAFENDPNVGVIVVTGAGRGFCAGADLGGLSSLSSGKPFDGPAKGAKLDSDERTVMFTTTIKKPVIAAINGPCAGIGLAFAMACDFRFCVPNAKLTLAFSRRGLVAEHGTSWTLPRSIGTGNALMLAMSGDVILGKH
jgi:enoyl-CoA hydratase/carnithine racemase